MHALPTRPTALVFDFDGTIADTRAIIVASYREAFARVGITCPTDQEISATIGIPLASAFRELTGANDELIGRAVHAYRDVFKLRGYEEVEAFPGMVNVVRDCRAAGFRMGIASSRSNQSLGGMVEHLGIADCFEVVASREDATQDKPHPELLLSVVSRFGLEPRQVLMVGDTTFDIEMGHAAGCLTCAVSWGNHNDAKLRSVHPTVLIDNAADFEPLLGLALRNDVPR
ncbi:MAG: HAD family hydrolase [Spirochaeta sp.]|nr:HAD family hydrolase [Spirochaeta sp.]